MYTFLSLLEIFSLISRTLDFYDKIKVPIKDRYEWQIEMIAIYFDYYCSHCIPKTAIIHTDFFPGIAAGKTKNKDNHF